MASTPPFCWTITSLNATSSLWDTGGTPHQNFIRVFRMCFTGTGGRYGAQLWRIRIQRYWR